MIEVEIRGRLTDSEYDALNSFLQKEGVYLGREEREMFLLYDYPGYNEDPTTRDVDIRLRSTNGNCEIMVKHKAHGRNVGRKEVSLKLKDSNLDNAKAIVKALGFKKAIKMNRTKELFKYNGIEWSLVKLPKQLSYFEAEKESDAEDALNEIQEELTTQAQKLNLKVLGPDETKEFISVLDEKLNTEVEL